VQPSATHLARIEELKATNKAKLRGNQDCILAIPKARTVAGIEIMQMQIHRRYG
jgi:hypothetical protein